MGGYTEENTHCRPQVSLLLSVSLTPLDTESALARHKPRHPHQVKVTSLAQDSGTTDRLDVSRNGPSNIALSVDLLSTHFRFVFQAVIFIDVLINKLDAYGHIYKNSPQKHQQFKEIKFKTTSMFHDSIFYGLKV